jgi:CheY-like chemotaxis protein
MEPDHYSRGDLMSELPVHSSTPGLLLSDDLIFASRVTGTAKELGRVVRPARTIDSLLNLARQQAPRCVLVDLAFPGLVLSDFLAQLRATSDVMPRIVGYGSHVDVAALKAAREAGCDPVLPRSKFVEDLPTQLVDWLDGG